MCGKRVSTGCSGHASLLVARHGAFSYKMFATITNHKDASLEKSALL